jgi:predicted lactoylglutathione lyase
MNRLIFINLPVRNLEVSTRFYQSLGFQLNPVFSGPTGSCIVVSDIIHVMLLTHDFFKTFTPLPIGDAFKSTQVLNCLSCSSRDEVNSFVSKATANGGRTYKDPMEHGEAMYGHSFQDPDGHIWEVMWMAAPVPPEKA